jgi:hypothetical protein
MGLSSRLTSPSIEGGKSQGRGDGNSEWVFGLPSDPFKVLDILIDIWPLHLHAFNLEACSFFRLSVLELVPELDQEVRPYIGDVFDEWV